MVTGQGLKCPKGNIKRKAGMAEGRTVSWKVDTWNRGGNVYIPYCQEKKISQSEARAAILVFRSAKKTPQSWKRI